MAAAAVPMRTDALFHVGTISQSMLAAMIFMIVEEGRLELGGLGRQAIGDEVVGAGHLRAILDHGVNHGLGVIG